MQSRILGFCFLALFLSSHPAPAQSKLGPIKLPPGSAPLQAVPRPQCPATPPLTFELREANPRTEAPEVHGLTLRKLKDWLLVPNATVLLGPDVVLDFSAHRDLLPLDFGPCVTLTSVDFFLSEAPSTPPATQAPKKDATITAAAPLASGLTLARAPGPGRTPHSPGPLLKFGSHPFSTNHEFLMVTCASPNAFPTNDHVRISGFRLQGPNRGQQEDFHRGIKIWRCLDIEISNMEIFGWGGAGVLVLDRPPDADPAGPGQEPPGNREGERIGRPDQVRILRNYFHHNQHPSIDDDSGGYGIDVAQGAWAQIHFNLFDHNRHAIVANGMAGGYDARWNLVLKGGGVHNGFLNAFTHQFDIHGTGDALSFVEGHGGIAAVESWFFENSFQYLNGPAISIRGTPRRAVHIGENVFAHNGLEEDDGDDAVRLWHRDVTLKKVSLSGNVINYDSYGRYGVCDFDGDGIDDLFLATGRTWWFSSAGEFPWSYLTARIETRDQVQFGYFDADSRCDVLTESKGHWVIASGGTGLWTSIGDFKTPLAQVKFGQFDPQRTNRQAGSTRQTTHAFRRLTSGQWQITSLRAPAWQDVQSSTQAFDDLRVGDFTGDGVTDILGQHEGHWAISESARKPWARLNTKLVDDLARLYIFDLDHNNIDDIVKLEMTQGTQGKSDPETQYRWLVSKDGRAPWQAFKTYRIANSEIAAVVGFAGRFGPTQDGAVMLIGGDRIGQFHTPFPRKKVLGKSDWRGRFAY